MQETPLLYTVEQAQHLLGIGRTRIYDLIKSGELEKVKIGNSTRIPHDDLIRFIQELRGRAA